MLSVLLCMSRIHGGQVILTAVFVSPALQAMVVT